MSESTTRIQLNSKAVELLFPEGSEQRVELTNAVKANVSKNLFDKAATQAALDEICKHHDLIKSILATDDIEKNLTSTPMWSSYTYLTKRAEEKLNEIIREEAKKKLESSFKHIEGEINEWFEANLEKGIEQKIKATIQRKVESIMNAKVSEKLKNLDL